MKNTKNDQVLLKSNQVLFFNKLKNNLYQNTNPVYDIASLLNISNDAVYRRLRGEKLLNFDEIITLCKHYNTNIDEFINDNPYEVKFQHLPMQEDFITYYKRYINALKLYMTNIVNDSSLNKKILFAATDIPIFHLCKFPVLKAFKIYTWYKLFEKTDESKFSADNIISPDLIKIFAEISDLYDQIDSIEIWTNNTLNSYLNLIKYFHDIDCFNSTEDAIQLCDQLSTLINSLKKYGEQGCKQYGFKESSSKLFFSEAELDNNLIYGETDNYQICFIKLYSINAINTSNKTLCNEIKQWFDNIINKSVLISGSSQKQFVLFLKEITGKIEELRSSLLQQ
jgi:hypothetical protein